MVVLDDDSSIHHLWKRRFLALENEINLISASTPDQFRNVLGNVASNTIFLCDQELIGFDETGLDLIENGRLENCILVTSHYEDISIRQRCERLHVRLIPKGIAGLVPIHVVGRGAAEW